MIGEKEKKLKLLCKRKIRIIGKKLYTFKCIQLGISIKVTSNLSFTRLCLVLFLPQDKKENHKSFSDHQLPD